MVDAVDAVDAVDVLDELMATELYLISDKKINITLLSILEIYWIKIVCK